MSRQAFTLCCSFIRDLAAEALACTDLIRLRVIRDAAEETRVDADKAVGAIYQTNGGDAGRECVDILKADVQPLLIQIRARLRWVEDPHGEELRVSRAARELAAQMLALGVDAIGPARSRPIAIGVGIGAASDYPKSQYKTPSQLHTDELARITTERDKAFAALRLAEPALRTLKDGHCDCGDCRYAKALDAVVHALMGAK